MSEINFTIGKQSFVGNESSAYKLSQDGTRIVFEDFFNQR